MPATSIALFPLGTVLYPGVVLPLHIFEHRYRRLIRDLLEQDAGPRAFGVVAIKQGRETGGDGVTELYDVGCTAVLQHVQAYQDGSLDIVTIGRDRFNVVDVDHSDDLVRASVEFLPDVVDSRHQDLVTSVIRDFQLYRTALGHAQGLGDLETVALPTDPVELSFVIATAMVLDVSDKQKLLAAGSAADRLQLARTFLHRESSMVQQLSSRPAVELPRQPYSQN